MVLHNSTFTFLPLHILAPAHKDLSPYVVDNVCLAVSTF